MPRLIRLASAEGRAVDDGGPFDRPYRPLDAEARAAGLFAAFERSARRHRAETAVATAEGAIAYGELLDGSLALAGRLAGAGVRAGDPVLVLAPQGPLHIRAVLACWRLGAAYVPLDPLSPPLRLRHVAAQCRDAVLVCQHAAAPLAQALARADRIVEERAADAPAALPELPEPSAPAFVVFTSGTTGLPKGVAKSQAAVLDAAAMRIDIHHLRAGDVLAYLGGPAVSANVNHVAAALLAGAAILVTRRDLAPAALLELLARHRTTHLAAYAGHLLALGRHDDARGRLATVEDVALFGDSVTWADLAALRDVLAPGALVSSIYGQTEASTTMFWFVPPAATGSGRVPIGRPMPGAQCWVAPLDEAGDGERLVGELCVAGPRVAAGYWGDAALDAARFLPHPEEPGRLVLKTGDVVAVPPDGPVELVGRADNMVKLRGWRIEIEEIETAARALAGVAAAGVVVRRTPSGAAGALALYLAPEEGAALDPTEAGRSLRQVLPSYMRPAAIEVMARLPMTATGKVDRPRLTELDAGRAAPGPAPAEAGGAPGLDGRLARVVAQELRLERVDPQRSFTDQGGDSLAALGVCLRLERLFGTAPDPEDLLGDQPLGELLDAMARRIRSAA